MKTSLAHLTPAKERKIRAIAQMIRDTLDVEMIILFGSFARNEQVADPVGRYFSDLDLLVIVKNERLVNRGTMWSHLRRRASRMSGKADVTIIVHSIEDVNEQLERGRYFFSDVKKDGILLHDAGRFTLAEEKPSTPAERQAYAQACFDRYFERANRFYRYFAFALENDEYCEAAFLLHQATETCYKTVLLVFTAYLPKSHRLEPLGKQCGDLHPAFRNVFPTDDPDDRRRFELLEAAYVEARYSMEFVIAREDLEILATHVRELCGRVEQACRERIASIAPPQ